MSNNDSTLPQHIGIIMDGNGRWAKKRHQPRFKGHIQGVETFKKIARYANKLGIKHMTVYAFSTENWKRPKVEVEAIMKLFYSYLEDAASFVKDNIKTRFVGDLTALTPRMQKLIANAEELSSGATGMQLNIAVNYGGRSEIVAAANKLVESGKEITEENLSSAMYTAPHPDIDLVIRPSGEYRTSNFLIWQSAYAEYVFMDEVLWPDFDEARFDEALEIYTSRNRRFGGI